MIHILFVHGSFGSMFEWGIRTHSNVYPPIPLEMKEDGSMHIHNKMCHIYDKSGLEIIKDLPTDTITTIIYPMVDMDASDLIKFFKSDSFVNDKIIIVTIPNPDITEIMILMQYYKIRIGINKTLDELIGENKNDIIKWNTNYQHWSDMQIWECREWFSLFYETWARNWILSKEQIPHTWLLVDPIDLVNDYYFVIKKCITHCGLNYRLNESAEQTIVKWCDYQKKIFKEHEFLKYIVKSVINNVYLEWKPLNILSEAIIQKRLRDLGYNLKCYNLNTFPTNSHDLYALLEKL